MPVAKRGNRVFKSLHKPLTYLGMERSLFFMVCVTAVGCFNLFNSILAGLAVFVAGFLFGLWVTNTEEEEKIVRAVEACRRRGWNVERPLPADTLFYRAQRGDFDLVIAMYHDQGHGPVKVLGLESGVNITIGLPVVRTSVDHGTAFDI